MAPRRTAPADRRPKAALRRIRLNRRERMTITIKHRGGAESWWELRARGNVYRRPGHTCIEDIFTDIYDGVPGSPSS